MGQIFHFLFQALQWWGGFPLAAAILGVGVYLTVRSGFFQLRCLPYILKNTLFGRPGPKKRAASRGDISPFQALTTALAATIGTGNIAGVATAISLGGPGAVFWMWVSAFFGMMLKFTEIVLAVTYRRFNREGEVSGGPMYVLADGMGLPWAGALFAIFGSLAAFGIGNMVQANTVADAVNASLGISPLHTGVLLALLTAAVILGGIKRLSVVTSRLVPLMTLVYIFSSLFILAAYRSSVLEAFKIILEGAFTGTAAVGGFAGAGAARAIRYGVTRGIFTNEAGLGSSAIAHAAARTVHPVRQGMWGILEVFIDTHLLCTLTALTLLSTGAWASGLEGASMTVEAFNRGLAGPGGLMLTTGLICFSFSTLLSWSYYGEKCFQFIFVRKQVYYRYFWVLLVMVGAAGGLRSVWAWADTLNALMAVPNLAALLAMGHKVVRLNGDYFAKNI